MQKNNMGWSPQVVGDEFRKGIYTEDEVKGTFGRISSPLLDLPLQNSLVMKAGVGSVTFTRSTTATYIDRYSSLQTATIDEARFEKDGLLIEGSSTNISLYSEDYTHWTKNSIIAELDNTVVNPYGALGAIKISGNVIATEHYTGRPDSITSSSDTYTMSVFVKKGTQDTIKIASYALGGITVSKISMFTFSTGTATSTGAKVQKLANGWYRISLPIIDNNSGNTTITWRVYVNDGSQVDTYDDYTYVFGGQIEKLPFVSSYIPTTTSAVTRGADSCQVTYNNNVPLDNSIQSFVVEASILGYNGDNQDVFHTMPSVRRRMWFNTTLQYGNGQNIRSTDAAPNVIYDIVGIRNGSSDKLYKDGILSSSTITQTDTTGGPDTELWLGSQSGTNAFLFGHVKNFKIYDFALSSVEVNLLG